MPDRAAVPRAEVPVGGGQPAQPGMAAPAHIDRLQYPWLPLVAWLIAQKMFWPLPAYDLPRWDFPPDPAVAAAAVFVSRCLLSGQPMPMQEAVECLVGTITDMAEAEAAVCVASLRERVAAAEQRTAAAEQRVATAREAAAAAQLQAAARVAAAELQVATERERAAAAERRAADAETAAARAQSAAAALRATLARVDAAARHNSLLASHEAGLRRHFEHIVWGQRVAEAAQAADIAALGPPVPDRPQ